LLDHPDTLPDDLFIISTIKTIGPCTKNTIVLVFENVVKEAVFTF
jgi:hypothetical protein